MVAWHEARPTDESKSALFPVDTLFFLLHPAVANCDISLPHDEPSDSETGEEEEEEEEEEGRGRTFGAKSMRS